MVFPVYPSTSIDFTGLISALSTPTHSKRSIKVRNRLLSPWTVPPLPKLSSSTAIRLAEHSSNPSSTSNLSSLLLSEVQADPDPWSTFKKFQPGIEIYLFGHPPNDVLNAASHSSSSNSDSNVSNLWSVLIFAPALPMPDRKSGPRIDLWLSSQSLLPSGSVSNQSHSDPQVSTSEQDLLHFIMNDWLAERLRNSANHQGQRSLEKSGQNFEEVSFTLCGIEQRICDLLTQWSGPNGQSETEKARKLLDYEVEWSGAYVSYSKESNTDDLNEMILRDIKKEGGGDLDLIEGRWKLESIEEKDLDLVRSTNKLPFPLEYVKSHLSHSIMLRDAKGSTIEGQEIGKPAGWVYNHDDLALASLHVPQNYRRIVSSSESSVKGKGIGTILMELITPRVALVQEYALKKSGNARLLEQLRDGNEAILTPCVAVTEVGNVPARKLFEKCGFVEGEEVAWVGMRLRE